MRSMFHCTRLIRQERGGGGCWIFFSLALVTIGCDDNEVSLCNDGGANR